MCCNITTLRGLFAEFERATIIDRVIGGMERKAAPGGWTGGPVLYGYRFVPRRLASTDGQPQVLTSTSWRSIPIDHRSCR